VRAAHAKEVAEFPRWSVLTGAVQQTHDDLLSLAGVFVVAVALGLANEVFPDTARAALPHRVVHGLIVVIGTLALTMVGDLVQRLALYQRRNRQAWMIRIADHAHLLGFAIDTRVPGRSSPFPVVFVIRKPSGDYVRPLAEEPDPAATRFYPPGTWAHIVEQPYEEGTYEARVYLEAPLRRPAPLREIARAKLEPLRPALTPKGASDHDEL
jgi:hypothetical protein